LQFSQLDLVVRVTEYTPANSFVEGALDAYERILRGEVDVADAAVFEHPIWNGIASFVGGWVTSTHDEDVVQEDLRLELIVPLVPVFHDIAHELQHVYSPEVVWTGEVALVAEHD